MLTLARKLRYKKIDTNVKQSRLFLFSLDKMRGQCDWSGVILFINLTPFFLWLKHQTARKKCMSTNIPKRTVRK